MLPISITQQENICITAELRIYKALASRIPPSADYILLLWLLCPRTSPIGQKIARRAQIPTPDWQTSLQFRDGKEVFHKKQKVIPDYILNEDSILSDLRSKIAQTELTLLTKPAAQTQFDTHVTEFLQPSDYRQWFPSFLEAKTKETEVLESRKVWTVIPPGSVSKNANVLGSSFCINQRCGYSKATLQSPPGCTRS